MIRTKGMDRKITSIIFKTDHNVAKREQWE